MYPRLINSVNTIVSLSTLAAIKFGFDVIFRDNLTSTFFSCLYADNIVENKISSFTKFKYTAAHFFHRIDFLDLKIGSNIAANLDFLTQNEVFEQYPLHDDRIDYYESLYRDETIYCTQFSNQFAILVGTEIIPILGLYVLASDNLFEIVDA